MSDQCFECADEHSPKGLAGGLAFHLTGKQIIGAVDNFDEFPDVRRNRRPILREILRGRFMDIQNIHLLFILQDIDIGFVVPLRYTDEIPSPRQQRHREGHMWKRARCRKTRKTDSRSCLQFANTRLPLASVSSDGHVGQCSLRINYN